MSRIGFFQNGFSPLPPDQVLNGDLGCFFHLDLPRSGSSGNEFSFTFEEYYPFAFRLLSWHESIHVKSGSGTFEIDSEITYFFLTDEKSVICRSPPTTGFQAIYRHNGGFGNQRFEMVYTQNFGFDGLTTDPGQVGRVVSPVTFSFFGKSGFLFMFPREEGEEPPTGSISVFANSYKTYDGIYDPGDGSQIIFPLPAGI